MTHYLARNTLGQLNSDVAVPRYDLDAVQIGVVHFGPGAFHRVHQAWCLDRVLSTDPRWGICEVSLRSPDVRDALAPQDGLYTIAVRDQTKSHQIIGAIRELLVAPESPDAVLARLEAPTTYMVTSTVTEKGYCLGANGRLDFTHPDIRRDIERPSSPVSLIGYLVEGLRLRREAGVEPFTVISCDNLVDNGLKLANAVISLAAVQDSELAEWIKNKVAFPRTMIDSITPATTDALRAEVAAALGVHDRWPVQREEFVQWVIEDRFGSPHPDWHAAGVTITDDVAAYDRAKLRLLNGAHSTLAYVGLLAGYETVSQAMADPVLAAFVSTMMTRDILPTIKAPRGLDLGAYIETILRRFHNPAIRHALAQIAWDGSQKLPFRLLGTIHDSLVVSKPIDRLCVPLAAWMHFVRRAASRGERVTDPLAPQLLEIGTTCEGRSATDLPLFLALEKVFPVAFAADKRFTAALGEAYDRLNNNQGPAVVESLRTWLC